MGSTPRSGRSPGGGHDNPLQYSCLENSMDRGGWWATVHRVAESDTSEAVQHSYTHSTDQICGFKVWSLDQQFLHFLGSQTSAHTYCIISNGGGLKICVSKHSRLFSCMLKFEKHWTRENVISSQNIADLLLSHSELLHIHQIGRKPLLS